jgi:replicative DNA helicase
MTQPELPQNVEAEKATLGSILLNREAIVAVAPWLVPAYFYLERHAQIFEAMLACYNARIPPDTRTVSEELRRRDRLEAVGGIAYLSDLVDTVPTSYHVEYYARVVERTALLRKLIEAGGRIAALGYDEQQELEDTLDKAEQTLFEVSQRRSTQDFVPISQVIDSYYEQINYLQEHRGEVVGVPSGFRDLDEITGGLQQSDLIILAARPSVGKCLPAWTLLDDPVTGARLTIEEYFRRKLPTVYGLDDLGHMRPTLVSAWIDSGIKPCFRVRTRTGRTLDATANHPFLTAHGWRPLSELAVGRSIAVPTTVPAFGAEESWPLELVRLLAYFIAEGGLTGSSPGFTNTDPVIVDDFKSIIAQHFPTCAIRQHKITYYASRPERGGIPTENPVYTWLAGMGLRGKLAKDKYFPACVWTWSRRYLAEFLRVLMSCDGSIYQVGGLPRIEFTVASERLASDLHHAFVRFGLIAKFYCTSHGAWRVEMTDPASVQRYQQEIGWIGAKRARFAELARTLPPRLSNIGHPPQETWQLVRSATAAQSLSFVELARRSGETVKTGKFSGYNPHTDRSLPRTRLARYAEVLDDDHLRKLGSSDIFWDPIVSIEPIGEHQVYDLTVPDGANFIAQDICAHNTSFVLSLGYNVATRHQRTVGIFSLEMSRDQLVQRLLSMDTRIDTHRLRTGHLGEADLQNVMESMGRLADVPIFIEDTPGLSVMEVRSKARRLQSQVGVDLIIIDYLQLMSGRRSDNRVQEVSEISRGLKSLARELNVPVIALSQLSRAVEGRQSHIPMLSDLRESGCLAGETLVYMPDEGVYRRLDELVGKHSFNVLAVNTETWKLEPRPVLNAFATGTKSVYRLTTRLGRTLRATTNHKFLTIQGWRRLDELAPKTRLALPRTLPSPIRPTFLQKLASSDVYWDEIISIEPDGEAEVYDLTVEGLHNFVAADIIAHNSIEQDADIVMFIYREELYDANTDKKGIAELHIAKHRNGPIGVVPMRFDAATTRFDDLTYRAPEGY